MAERSWKKKKQVSEGIQGLAADVSGPPKEEVQYFAKGNLHSAGYRLQNFDLTYSKKQKEKHVNWCWVLPSKYWGNKEQEWKHKIINWVCLMSDFILNLCYNAQIYGTAAMAAVSPIIYPHIYRGRRKCVGLD